MGRQQKQSAHGYGSAFIDQPVLKTPCLFHFRSIKFHRVEETHMMLVAL